MPKLKELLKAGQTALGTHVSLNDCALTEAIGLTGYDYIWIDTEHTAISLNALEHHLMAARAAGVSAIVRVPWNDAVRLKPVLEMGPDGIVIPMVNSAEEARAAIRACVYPPAGIRGYGPRYACRYGLTDSEAYIAEADGAILKLLQIEHILAYHNLDEILEVEGADAFIIGPCDLAASMGFIGKWNRREVLDVINDIVNRAHAAGKPIGASVGLISEEDAARWMERGLDMLSLASDLDYIVSGAKANLNMMKRLMTARSKK